MNQQPYFSVQSVRRSVLLQPLAVLLSILMLPVFSGLGRWSEGAQPFQANAQAIQLLGCGPTGATTIIQLYCGADGSLDPAVGAALLQFESDAVQTYLAFHLLPSTDSNVIYDYGRSDLRSAVRAQMFSKLLQIVRKAPGERTAQEQLLYSWFQKLVQRNEINLYTTAYNHYLRYLNDPCRFQLDSTVAGAMKISYDGASTCFQNRFLTLQEGPPAAPSADYFLQYGLSQSYGKIGFNYPYAAKIVAESSMSLTEQIAIGATAGVIISSVVGGLISASIAASVAFTLAPFTAASGMTYSTIAIISSNAVSAVGGTVAAIAGPVAIIVMALTIAVIRGIQAVNLQANQDNLAKLEGYYTRARTTLPDLAAMQTDGTGFGLYKLHLSFIGETFPEMESSAPLPAPRSFVDSQFRIDKAGSVSFSDTLRYKDWSGKKWAAKTWGGWFTSQCTPGSDGLACSQNDSIIARLQFTNASGNFTASRIKDKFVISKKTGATTDKPCPPDQTTGVTNQANLSSCLSYVSDTIKMFDDTGALISVSLSNYTPPVFTGPSVVSFSPGVASTATIAVTGNPAPLICKTANGIPTGLIVVPSCSASPFTITYDGSGTPPVGSYTVSLTAFNSMGTSTRDVTVNVGTTVRIVTPPTLSATYGQPVNFTVVAQGSPKPRFTVDPNLDLQGLTFRDNLDGTATISGMPAGETIFSGCVEIVGTTCPRIRATNGVTSDSQIFEVQVAGPGRPQAIAPFNTTFTAGIANEFNVSSLGATTPVTWKLDSGSVLPPWMQLRNNADGTATLFGTPPLGTTGTFRVSLVPSAVGSRVSIIQSYTIDVVSVPVFLNSNVWNTQVGGGQIGGVILPGFPIRSTGGTASLVTSELPPGVIVQPGPTAAGLNLGLLSGNPPAGSGGQYQLQFASTNAQGTTYQDFFVRIGEQPRILGEPVVVLFAGRPASFSIGTTGYPSIGAPWPFEPSSFLAPRFENGMFFKTEGLPPSLTASNLSSTGLAMGTLTIEGTPTSAEIGTYRVLVTANNNIGQPAQKTITVQVLPYAPTTAVTLLSVSSFARTSTNDILATVVVTNTGNMDAQNVSLTSVRLGGATGTIDSRPPVTIPAASTASFKVLFPAGSFSNSPVQVFSVNGSYTGGSFSSSLRATLP